MSAASPTEATPRLGGFQFRLGTLLALMVWVGLSCAALATPTRFWAAMMLAIMLLSLLTSVLVAIYRRSAVRAFAVGFLVFGGGYMACLWLTDGRLGHDHLLGKMPTDAFIDWLYAQYHAKITHTVVGGGMGMAMGEMMPSPRPVSVPRYLLEHFSEVAHCVLSILLGLVGGVIARFLFITQKSDLAER